MMLNKLRGGFHMKNTWIKSDLFRFIILLGSATLASSFLFITAGNSTNCAIFYMLAIFLISRYTTGYIWGILASIAGVIAINYFFTFPYMKIDFLRDGYPITFSGMLTVSLITSTTATHLNTQKQEALSREKMLEKINHFNNHLLSAKNKEEMLKLSISFLSELNKADVLFVPNEIKKETISNYSVNHYDKSHVDLNDPLIKEYIKNTLNSNELMTLTKEEMYYTFLPISSSLHKWGTLVLYSRQPQTAQMELNRLMIPQLSLSLEHYSLIEHHQTLIMDSEKEKMRSNLLRAVSHDLRTPLTGIIGSSSTYLEAKAYLNEESKDKLIRGILEDANWLLNMVENLLTITKISQETALVKKVFEPIEEVVSEALMRFQKRYPKSHVIVKIPDEFLMVPMDATLIEQVIINLLENAVKHSNSTKATEFTVENLHSEISFSIKDYGQGIPEERLSSIFDGSPISTNDKNDRKKGMGIGLTICKTIILAHQGRILASNHSDGAIFSFYLPVEGGNSYENK